VDAKIPWPKQELAHNVIRSWSVKGWNRAAYRFPKLPVPSSVSQRPLALPFIT
jgi:hypothetical protein